MAMSAKSKRNARSLVKVGTILGASILAVCASAGQAKPVTDPLAPAGRWTAPDRGHAPTPPMGWNSWNAFQTGVDEAKVLGSAQALVDTGLAKLGYVYVNLDDGWWQKRRQPDGRMQVRTSSFPSAKDGPDTTFRPLVDRLHGMGLKAGIYTDLGRNTCSQAYSPSGPNMPEGSVAEREVGIYGHVDGDIRTYFADWRFDYIKVDACGITDYTADRPHMKPYGYRVFDPIMFHGRPALNHNGEIRALYQQVSDALAKYRPDNDYVFSLCSWGQGDVRAWGKQVGNTWRTSDDLYPQWPRMLHNFDSAATRELYSHPGAWNDPDMLFVGAGDFDENHLTEARTHFSLWAMLDAPLLIGYDLRKAPKPLLDIWGNADIIALDQDKAGNQAVLAYRSGEIDILVKTLADGRKAVAVFNRDSQPFTATLTAAHLKFDPAAPVVLTDLWTKEKLAPFTHEQKFVLAAHETRVFMADGARSLPQGLYLSEMTGRINVAEDGIRIPEPDPEAFRTSSWGSTQGGGDWPVYAGWGGAQPDASPYSTGLAIGTHGFATGIGILANSRMEVRANGEFKHFTAEVGVDNATRNRAANVQFFVYGDGRLIAKTPAVAFGAAPVKIDADVSGVKIVELVARSSLAADPVAVTWGDAALLR